MNLELTAIPLSYFSGLLSILSPCVWPLIPVVMSSAALSGKKGPIYLALGLMGSFAAAGTLLTFLLMQLGLDPETFRYLGAIFFALLGLTLLFKPLESKLSNALSSLTSRLKPKQTQAHAPESTQFIIGLSLGLIWLPCVGPTVGTAIALASMGQSMFMAFIVLLAFAFGTATTLLIAGMGSKQVLLRLRPQLMSNAAKSKKGLGLALLILSAMTLTGIDKLLMNMTT